MQVGKFEFKKMFIKQYGVIIVLIFLILKILGLIIFDNPRNLEMYNKLYSYNFYLEHLQGKLTEEKKDFFLNEQNRIVKANSSIQILNNKYYDGEINQVEYNGKLEELEETLKNEKGFEVIYNQFLYSMESPNDRYIMQTNGWEGILVEKKLDWLYVLLILLLITPVFCEEFVSEMDITILTQVRGGRYSARRKIIISIIVAIMISIIGSLTEYVFFLNKYGLENSNFPLQSLNFFDNSSKNTSILAAFFGMFLLKIFGSIFLTTLILFLSIVLRRYALVLLITTSILMLPNFMFFLQSTRYRIPSPLGFLIPSGYYSGDKYSLDFATRQNNIVFNEISNREMFIIILISLIIVLGMICFIIYRSDNVLYKSNRKNREV